jgi:hypothetical protein
LNAAAAHDSQVPGAEEGRNQMFRNLMAQAAQDIAALVYVLPYIEQDNLYSRRSPPEVGRCRRPGTS